MGRDFRSKIQAVAFALIMLAWGGHPAALQAASKERSIGDQLNLLENRFFFRLYLRDPIEKRLERLELLVFGATQGGDNAERIDRLKKTVSDRDSKSSDWSKAQGSADGENGHGGGKVDSGGSERGRSAGAGSSSSQYPILNTLEWRALKKTYPGGSLDQRLERLETKLFGQPSPAMAYADRVDRLKRTLGVGIAQGEGPPVGGPPGPMPKAKPRSLPDIFGSAPPPETIDPFGGLYGTPFGAPGNSPFGTMPGFSEMFKHLEQEMEQMRRMPLGVWQWDPKTGSWYDPTTGRRFKPGQEPVPKEFAPLIPRPSKPKVRPYIPPYDDPNSI